MNSKTILGISLAAIFAVSMTVGQSALAGGGEIPEIDDTKIKIKKNKIHVTIETKGNIPQDGSVGLFGYGILTSGTQNVLALTTHLCASDSPIQGNAPNSICPDANAFGLLQALTGGALLNKDFDGALWHPHILDLKAADGLPGDPAGGCASIAGADFEVDLTSTAGPGNNNNVSPTDYKLKVHKDKIKIQAPLGGNDVNPDGSGIAVATFGIGATTDGMGNINDLCLINTSFL